MKYRVNEIFHSVQAEGHNAGRSAVFVRFSGCNLQCPFCDTNHEPFTEMTADEINSEIRRLSPDKKALVVFTGGEPLLQLHDSEELAAGYSRAIESNGILPLPEWWTDEDWLTISPKTSLTSEELFRANEIKMLYGLFSDAGLKEIEQKAIGCYLYVQPIERGGDFDIEPVVDFVRNNPAWRISVQWHKLTGVR